MWRTSERGAWCLGFFLCISAAYAQERPTQRFTRDWLVMHARELAEEEHERREMDSDSPLRQLSYDQYRAIRFQRGASIWRGEGREFTVDLFHPGFLFTTPVEVNLVVDGIARRVAYTTDIFDYGLDTGPMKEVEATGYSGFRIAAHINSADIIDEFLVFQGASYFRAVGRDQGYGISARGLAVNTARPKGEEFPAFTEFWIERPALDADQIVIHALLESPSITGAYTFTSVAGAPTVIDVQSVLFPRIDISAYGIAPLTSMFLFDSTNRGRFDDFRQAVHDSDGLSILMSDGTFVWRPLANPRTLQVSAFVVDELKGFGLIQRHREFSDFEDIEARYDLRPSAWIEPVGNWGRGHVELIEIPTNEEIHDNIVAFWQPAEPLRAGERYEFSYRMSWGVDRPADPAGGPIVVATRAGGSVRSDVRRFAVDLSPGIIPEDPEISVSASAGTIIDARGLVIDTADTYRINFIFDPEGADVAELRLEVSSGGKRWGETWLYRWTR